MGIDRRLCNYFLSRPVKTSMNPNKICLSCHKDLPVTLFKKCAGNSGGLQHYCKDCSVAYPESCLRVLGDKKCPCCGEAKPRTDFYARSNRKGLSSKCKTCESASIIKWVQNLSPDKAAKRNRRQRDYQNQPKIKDRYRAVIYQKGKRQTDTLADGYVLHLVAKSLGCKKDEVKSSGNVGEIITTKRTILQLKRTLKKVYQNSSYMNNIDLRGVLTQTLTDLVNDSISVDKANGIARLSDVILKTAIAEAQHNRKASTFFKSPGEK